ncbi:MAG: hypothetical protein DWQ02_00890 [Bacteroidetes bacterium]|nr:MAG: hypothetical protein DWQ02_00890 [Bacteroidota bacterium]
MDQQIIPISQLTPQDRQSVLDLIESLFEHEPHVSVQVLQEMYQQVGQDANATLKMVLETFWNFFQSQVEFTQAGNIPKSIELLSQAKENLELLDLKDNWNIANGLLLYYMAVYDIRQQNISAGLDKLKEAKETLQKVDKFGSQYQSFIDHFEPESFYIAGVQSMMQYDYSNGDIMIEKAAEASKSVAKKYYEKNSMSYNTFYGLGHAYKALYHLFYSMNEFNKFNFDLFVFGDNETRIEAEQAIAFLSIGDLSNININNSLFLCKTAMFLSEALTKLGISSYNLLKGDDDEIADLKSLKQVVRNAKKMASKSGPSAVVYVRFCDQTEEQIYNLERLVASKVKRKDLTVIKDSEEKSGAVAEKSNYVEMIGQGKVEKVLSMLIKQEKSPDLLKDFILLSSQWQEVKRKEHLQLITAQNAAVAKSQITEGLLNIME